jgi:hypothetical protein
MDERFVGRRKRLVDAGFSAGWATAFSGSGVPFVLLAAITVSISAADNPASRSTSTVCSPSCGAGRRTVGAHPDQRLGTAMTRSRPSLG